jgi:hypothetical protein
MLDVIAKFQAGRGLKSLLPLLRFIAAVVVAHC